MILWKLPILHVYIQLNYRRKTLIFTAHCTVSTSTGFYSYNCQTCWEISSLVWWQTVQHIFTFIYINIKSYNWIYFNSDSDVFHVLYLSEPKATTTSQLTTDQCPDNTQFLFLCCTCSMLSDWTTAQVLLCIEKYIRAKYLLLLLFNSILNI